MPRDRGASRDGRNRTDAYVFPKHAGYHSPTPRWCDCVLSLMTRVGFEPDLAGLKDRQPHQKSNGPLNLLPLSVRSISLGLLSPFVFGLKRLP